MLDEDGDGEGIGVVAKEAVVVVALLSWSSSVVIAMDLTVMVLPLCVRVCKRMKNKAISQLTRVTRPDIVKY